jgi:hypothetical protein
MRLIRLFTREGHAWHCAQDHFRELMLHRVAMRRLVEQHGHSCVVPGTTDGEWVIDSVGRAWYARYCALHPDRPRANRVYFDTISEGF